MSKDKISDYSATANSNTDIAGINIDEGCAPSGINNAIRTLMKQLKDFQQGTNSDSFNGPTNGAHNGSVGATTPAAGTFTTLSATGNVTLGDASADTVTVNGTTNFVAAPTIGGVGLGMGFKNRIINGAMTFAQRATTATATDGGYPSIDRYQTFTEAADGVFTFAQVTDAPTGYAYSAKVTVTTADASIGASQRYLVSQCIEGTNLVDFSLGTASAVSFTISFWVKSSLTGSFGGSVLNSAFNRAYPFSYTINSANTWEQKTVTIAGDTSGTWLTTTSVGMRLMFSVGAGSSASGTANTWASSGYYQPTGSVNLISTLNATLQITGVQLEKGSTATSFDYRPYGTELALCQRYYERCVGGSLTSINTNGGYIGGAVNFCVAKRASPTVTRLSDIDNGGVNTPFSETVTINAFRAVAQVTTSGTAKFQTLYEAAIEL